MSYSRTSSPSLSAATPRHSSHLDGADQGNQERGQPHVGRMPETHTNVIGPILESVSPNGRSRTARPVKSSVGPPCPSASSGCHRLDKAQRWPVACASVADDPGAYLSFRIAGVNWQSDRAWACVFSGRWRMHPDGPSFSRWPLPPKSP